MKYILLLLSSFIISCNNGETVEVSKTEYTHLKTLQNGGYPINLGGFFGSKSLSVGMEKNNVYITIIDSCEYLMGYIGYHGGPIVTHRARCKYCLQRKLNDTIKP